MRFGMEITELSDLFAASGFKVFRSVVSGGGVVKAVNAKSSGRCADSRGGRLDSSGEGIRGLGGMAYIRVQEDGTWKSPIVKFFSDEEKAGIQERLNVEAGDLLLFAADKPKVVHPFLGKLRLLAGEKAGVIDNDKYAFVWVTDFPPVRTQ